MTDEALVETTARRLEANGVPILVVSFAGKYGIGCQGNGDAHKMAEDLETLLAQHEDVEALVFDGTGLWYKWGDQIGHVMVDPRPWVWAATDDASGLVSYLAEELSSMPSELLFPSVDAAIAEVCARVVREVTELHDPNGALRARWQREPRGRRALVFQEGVVVCESLYARAAQEIERTSRDQRGQVQRLTEWPFPDAEGGENQACHLGARIEIEAGVLRTIDFTPCHTRRPLPANWLARVLAHPTVTKVVLDETGVSDQEVTALLTRFPTLEHLSLNGLHLQGTFLHPPFAAGNLRNLDLFQESVPNHLARAFAKANPPLQIGYDGMFEKE